LPNRVSARVLRSNVETGEPLPRIDDRENA
jgi:hypothetical protein